MVKATIKGSMTITGLERENIHAVKRALTIPNPKYKAAMKYGGYGYTSLPSELYYYRNVVVDGQKGIQVPVGFDVTGKGVFFDEIDDCRVNREVNFPRFRLMLRDDQYEAYKAFDSANDFYDDYEYTLLGQEGYIIPAGLIQLPTGKGKTVAALYIAAMFRQKTLVLVHKNDLLSGWEQDIERCFGGEVKMGLIQGKTKRISDHVTLAMVQTLSRWRESDLKSLSDEFGLIICDECHHAPASSYNLIENFNAYYRLGLSATPERSDGLTPVMGFYFGDFAYKYKHRKKDKDILPVEVIHRQSSFKFVPCLNKKTQSVENLFIENDDGTQTLRKENDLIPFTSMSHSQRPDIKYHAIEREVLGSDTYLHEVCADILAEFHAGANCIAFFSQKALLERFYDHLVDLIGTGNVQTFYGDSNESDEAIKERAESGKVRITLTTYSKGTEGTNVKAWDTAFLVSSINNEKNVEQAVGRIRRAKQGKRNVARVYDYRHPDVYGWKHHGMTRDARYLKLKFKLPGQKKYSRGYSV